MGTLPVYLWVVTYATVAAMAAATAYVLYRGAVDVGLGLRRVASISIGSVVVLGGWLAATSVIASQGGYHTRIGHGVPWLPVAVLGFLGSLILLSRLPSVARALNAPDALSRLMLPHAFRIEGLVFIVAMLLGKLPALFAVPAGLGDIAVGVATPWIVRKLAEGTGERAALWFNALGAVDLIDAIVLGGLTAYNVVSVHPAASLNSELPLAIVPTFGVPLLFALHVRSLLVLRNKSAVSHSQQLSVAPAGA
jgi:hypothetical protein